MIDRLNLLRASTSLTGIDFIQVSPSQRELLVFLQHDSLPAALQFPLFSGVMCFFILILTLLARRG